MNKLVVGGLVASALAFGAYKVTSTAPSKSFVVDRLWIDHIPKDERDPIKIFAAITEEPVGIFQTTSAWTGQYEIFQHETSGNELRAVYPQTREKETIAAKGGKCNDEHFDFCLELSGNSRGAKKYFSMKGWELDGLDEAAALAKIKKLEETLGSTGSLVHAAPDVE